MIFTFNSYFKKFPEIRDYMQETLKFCRKNGFVETMFGRKCHFPNINDKNFNKKIYNHPLFKKYKYPNVSDLFNNLLKSYENNKDINDKTKLNQESIFKLSLSQKFLRNFMSPYSPYNGVFIIHGTGVGKTCTAITIAENLKQYVKMNAKRIYIIRPDSFKEQLFEMEKVKKNEPQMQCTGTSYLEEVKRTNPVNEEYLFECVRGDTDACDRLHKNIKKEIEKKIK